MRNRLKDLAQYEDPKRKLDEADRLIEQEKESAQKAEQTIRELQSSLESEKQTREQLTTELTSLPQLTEELVRAETEHRELSVREKQAQESVGRIKGILQRTAELEERSKEKEELLSQASKEETIYRELAQAFGINRSSGFIVTQIESGSPADKAGIKVGDVIVAANDKAIRSASDMHNLVGLQRLGQTIELVLYRNGSEVKLPVLIQPIEINKLGGGVIHPKLAGATIGEMREQHLQRWRVDYLEVMKVERGSNADASGFRVGDIIFSINKQLTRTFDEVFALVETNGKGMIMNIQRGNRELYILLK